MRRRRRDGGRIGGSARNRASSLRERRGVCPRDRRGQTGLTDPNNVSEARAYDSFGRQSSFTKADGNKSAVSYAYCANVNGGSAPCPQNGAYALTITPTTSAKT